jgi:trigger factor
MTNIEIEDISDVKKKLTFEVPQERVVEVVDSQYKDLKKTAQIRGFRRGKVPLNILRSYFKGQVEEDAVRKIIEETFQPGLDEQSIKPVSVIRIDPEAIEVGKPFKYTAEIEVPPKIDLADYKGIELTRYIRKVTDQQIEERLQVLRERNSTLSPIPESRAITAGDHLVVDVKAHADGAPIQELSVTDYHLEMGRDFYLPGFDSMLEGLKPEEAKQFTMVIPDSFPRKNLVGKTVSFDVTLREAKERLLPDLDDDFAKDLGEYESLAQLKEEIGKDIQEYLDLQCREEVHNQIADFLIEKNSFEVPESMVEQQIDNVLNRSLRNLAAQGIDPKRIPPPTDAQRDRIRPTATKKVKASLLLRTVAEQEKIEVSDEDVTAEIERRAKDLGVTPDYLQDVVGEAIIREQVQSELVESKTFKLIEESAQITEREPLPEEETSISEGEEK